MDSGDEESVSSGTSFDDTEHYISSICDRLLGLKRRQAAIQQKLGMVSNGLSRVGMSDLNGSFEVFVMEFVTLNGKLKEFLTRTCPVGLQNLDPSEMRTAAWRSLSARGEDHFIVLLQGLIDYERSFEETDDAVDILVLEFQGRQAATSRSEAVRRPTPTARDVWAFLGSIDIRKFNAQEIDKISGYVDQIQRLLLLQRTLLPKPISTPPVKSKIEAAGNKPEAHGIETKAAAILNNKPVGGIEAIGSSERASIASDPYAEVLDLLEKMEATEQIIKKLMEGLSKAQGIRMEFVDLKKRVQEFVKVCFPHGDRNLDPSLRTMFQPVIREFNLEHGVIKDRVCTNPLILLQTAASRQVIPPSTPANRAATAPKETTGGMNLQVSGTNRKLSGIIVDLYGFELKEAHQIEMEVAGTLPGSGLPTGALILNWKAVRGMQETLQCLKANNQEFQHEIPKALKSWIFCLESQIYSVVRYLWSMLSGYERASKRFQELRSALVGWRDNNHGIAPIIVHKILALLRTQAPVEASGFNRDQQATLYRDTYFDMMIDSIHVMIFQVRFALMGSDTPKALTISPYVVGIGEEVLKKAEEDLKTIEERIMEGRKLVRQKRKREDEAGPSSSWNESPKMTENSEGKRVRRE